MTAGVSTNPYVGLRPFTRDDSLRFFGRREQTDDLLEALGKHRFLAVVGGSGCGKSSLIRAGLIPELLGGFLVEERDRWWVAAAKPGDAPMRNLAAALLKATTEGEVSRSDVEALREAVAARHAQAVVDHLMPFLRDDGNLLLLVDQFEEIFAFRGLEEEKRLAESSSAARVENVRRRQVAADFVDLLLELGQLADLPLYVVLTMRTDFLGDCDLFYGLPEAMNRGRYLVPRLSRQQLKQAILGPARLSGARIEPRLLDLLLNELGDRTDRLPVLQHALFRTWEIWRASDGDGAIDLEHYRAAGTLEAALSLHAEEALRETDSEAAGRLFKCLTTTDSGSRRVRRSAALSELVAVTGLERETVEDVLGRFHSGGRNFVVLSAGVEPDDPRVDISHESLIRQWGRLRTWVDEERESRDRFVDLVRDARRATAGKRGLLQNPELQLAVDWREANQPSESWAERYSWREDDFTVAMAYLERSHETFGFEALRRRRRIRISIWVTATVVALSLSILTVWALRSQGRAKDQLGVSVAGEWVDRDPTMAALALLEIESPDRTPYAPARIREVLDQRLSSAGLHGHGGEVWWSSFSPDGDWIVSASFDHTARVWRADGTGDSIVLRGHDSRVLTAFFSGDGSRIVTASADATARIWASDGSGKAVILRGHQGEILHAEFSPDDSRVVTASDDGTARVWRADGVGPPVALRGHEGPVRRAKFSPDGTRVVTCSNDGTARIWRADGNDAPIILRGHEDAVNWIDSSPDGERVATASDDRTVRIWSADGRSKPIVLRGHEEFVWRVAFSPDGTRVVSSSVDRTARVWGADGLGEPVTLGGHQGIVNMASFSPDGAHVVTASYDSTARVWRADGRGEPVVLRGHRALVSRASFSTDGMRILTSSLDGTTRVWSVEGTGEPVVLQAHQDVVVNASFGPGGTHVITASDDKTVRVWRADGTGEPVVLRGHEARVRSAALSPDGTRVVTASDDGTVRIWSADGTGVELVLEGHEGHEGQVLGASFSADGGRVVTHSVDATARVWRADGKGEPVVLSGHGELVSAASFSSDGTKVVTASDDGTARVWRADGTGEPVVLSASRYPVVWPWRGHESIVNSASFSPDGTRVITASDDFTARVWRADGTGEPVALQGHEDRVVAAAFSPDGTKAVTASFDGTARVWNLEDPAGPLTLRGHEDVVHSAVFSPDGSRIVTASSDRTARVWNADGVDEQILRGHEGRVWSAVFSPDGARIVTASEDHTARVWRARGAELKELIRRSTSICLSADFRQKYFGESREGASLRYEDCERSEGRRP